MPTAYKKIGVRSIFALLAFVVVSSLITTSAGSEELMDSRVQSESQTPANTSRIYNVSATPDDGSTPNALRYQGNVTATYTVNVPAGASANFVKVRSRSAFSSNGSVDLNVIVDGVPQTAKIIPANDNSYTERTWTLDPALQPGNHSIGLRALNITQTNRVIIDYVYLDGIYKPPDGDGDGVKDSTDNCVAVANPAQTDLDSDGGGDACDEQDNRDTDGDTLENWEDDCIDEAGPASNGGCPLPIGPYSGIRFTPTVGVATAPTKIMTATGVQDLYNTYMKSAYHGADDSVDFAVQTKLDWPEAMKNPAVKPTLAQMADPDWSGYIWNDPTHPDYAELTEIDKMLAAPCVQDGKCKVSINIGTGATGGTNPPAFMLYNGLAWEGQGSGTYIRVKWYEQEARDYAEAFTLAALHRFDDGGISSVKLNEYFPGSVKPADWTASGGQDAYEDGYYTYAQNVIAGAPRDANGERVALYQTNPLANSDAFTPAQISSLMLGIAGSNNNLFDESPSKDDRRGLHGVVPMSAPLDAVPFRNGSRATWDGTPNPWGYTNGQTVTVTAAHVAWYHGHFGVMPMDQEFITKPGIPTDQFQAAMDLLGPGGRWHDQWGGVAYE